MDRFLWIGSFGSFFYSNGVSPSLSEDSFRERSRETAKV